jgi:hypothetical protein
LASSVSDTCLVLGSRFRGGGRQGWSKGNG